MYVRIGLGCCNDIYYTTYTPHWPFNQVAVFLEIALKMHSNVWLKVELKFNSPTGKLNLYLLNMAI